MIDLRRVVGFQWDQGNNRKSAVSQSEAEEVFFNTPLLTVSDAGHSRAELRFHALGVTKAGRRLHITLTLREATLREANTLIRVISARDMSRKERARYEQET